ncbi:hypothetical protein DFH94DRAFT_694681 [Russula ochroleuca]|uniref:Nucleoside diphosphate kinase n=1 Tax=Russula ochroleuca TaxID=152965 RepID=A0A9P5T5V3_9AGAM|nr:hypothetical protein DFH94DRAFT_694681 [Russula ochroleuca]
MSDQNLLGISTTNKDAINSSSTPTPTSPLVSSQATRTVAIIKPHAVDHRFEIEHRITEAKFEILKERQMEFDMETDPDALFELFGDDARSFAEGPVWVYVLERRRAIEVWNTIMGDVDPHVARQLSPNSLRALYGITKEQNAVLGSPDVETAEIQIASLFVSSPPFPTSVLPDDFSATDGHALTTGSLRSLSSSVPSSYLPPRATTATTMTTTTTTTATHSPPGSSFTNSNSNSNSTSRRTSFKAREIPLSHVSPTIMPRTTRAADLRAGVTPPKIMREHGPRTPPSKEAMKRMFANVPGHKRTESIPVASTLAPTMQPRMSRAASLRIEGTPPPKPVRPKPIITLAQAKAKAAEEERAKAVLKEAQKKTFDGVPGHKRRESFSVSSTKTPTVTPRQNRSALLRASKDSPPPSSYQFRPPIGPSLSRSTSSLGSPIRPPSAQGDVNSPRRSLSRMSDAGGVITRPSSLQAPTMAPRQNRSAMLRVAKMANGA